MTTEIYDIEQNYQYVDFEDAPNLHRQICTFSCSDVLSPTIIAQNLKCSINTVHRVLAHPPIQQEIERRRSMQIYDVLDSFGDMSEIRREALRQLRGKLEDGALSDAMTLKLFEAISDRHPDRAMLKQTKQINESGSGKAKSEQLSELRSRAEALLPVNVAKFEARAIKQAEAVGGET